MRICHVIDYFHTDVGYQEFFLAREQATAGHSVRVVSSMLRQHTVAVPGPDEARGLAQLRAAGVDLVRLPARQLGHDRTWMTGLHDAISLYHPDAAHVHGAFSPTTARAVRACHGAGAAVLVDNHIQEAIAPGSTTPVARATYAGFRAAFGRSLRRDVGAWVANGPHEATFLAERMSLPIAKVELVPLGFDPQIFCYDAARRDNLRRQYGWADDVVVAVTGKLHAGKRVEAVAAATEVVASTSDARLVLAGSIDETYATTVRAAAPKLDGEGRIEIRPMLAQRDLADLYLAADVVAFARLPSISIYEAIGTGARVLVGDDEFARWLHSLCDVVEPVQLDDLADRLQPADDRAARAAAAASALGWPSVSAAFVERYERIRCAS